MTNSNIAPHVADPRENPQMDAGDGVMAHPEFKTCAVCGKTDEREYMAQCDNCDDYLCNAAPCAVHIQPVHGADYTECPTCNKRRDP